MISVILISLLHSVSGSLFTTIEAEDGNCGGQKIGPSYNVWRPGNLEAEVESEASGRMACKLFNRGDSLTVRATDKFTHLAMRYALPESSENIWGNRFTRPWTDATVSLRVNGDVWPDVPITSRYSWYYAPGPGNPGLPDWNVGPTAGQAHHFFDEVQIGPFMNGDFAKVYNSGAEIKIILDSDVSWLMVDLLDLYFSEARIAKPANSVDVSDFGADPTGKSDSRQAFLNAYASARNNNLPVWIPAGEFLLDLTVGIMHGVDDLTIMGAGMMWTKLKVKMKNSPVFRANSGATIKDLSVLGDVRTRVDTEATSAMEGKMDSSLIQNVWMQHTKCGMWFTGPASGLRVDGVIVRDVSADGINLNTGFINSVIENSSFRNTGDDGIALWSLNGSKDWNVVNGNDNIIIRNNLVELPTLANGIAAYGGSNTFITGNRVSDTIANGGCLHIGTRFGATPISGQQIISNNVCTRTGGVDTWTSESDRGSIGAIFLWALELHLSGITISGNKIINPIAPAFNLRAWDESKHIWDVKITNNSVEGGPIVVFAIEARGSATFTNLQATGQFRKNAGVADCMPYNSFTIIDGGQNGDWLCKDNSCGQCKGEPTGACVSWSAGGCLPKYISNQMFQLTRQPTNAPTAEPSFGNVPIGVPGKDYPNYAEPPETDFTCEDKVDGGFYADPRAGCQAWHKCTADDSGRWFLDSFLCPKGTIFNQWEFSCVYWFNFDCSTAVDLYYLNAETDAEHSIDAGYSGRLANSDGLANSSILIKSVAGVTFLVLGIAGIIGYFTYMKHRAAGEFETEEQMRILY